MRVPRVLTSDGHVVVVEDVPGPRLADVVETTTGEVFERLGRALGRLRAVGADRCGRPGAPLDVPFPDLVWARARRHLLFAAARDPQVAAVAGDLRAVVGRLQDAVRPRAGYSLVHGELGPEHVIVAPGDEPVLVDVEGLMFADAEWEHAYLRMRLGRRHAVLDPGDLDPARLELYRVALHLSLVAGPLRLADAAGALGAVMRDIAGHHAAQLVAAARPAGAT